VKEISKLLRQVVYILPTQVRRKGKKLVDNLENLGCRNGGRTLDSSEAELIQMEEMENLMQLPENTNKERGILDLGTSAKI